MSKMTPEQVAYANRMAKEIEASTTTSHLHILEDEEDHPDWVSCSCSSFFYM